MESTQMTPLFHLLFQLFATFIFEFENSFSCGPSTDTFCSVKYLNFLPKATDSDSSSSFSRKQTPWGYEKSILFVLQREPKKVSAHGLVA